MNADQLAADIKQAIQGTENYSKATFWPKQFVTPELAPNLDASTKALQALTQGSTPFLTELVTAYPSCQHEDGAWHGTRHQFTNLVEEEGGFECAWCRGERFWETDELVLHLSYEIALTPKEAREAFRRAWGEEELDSLDVEAWTRHLRGPIDDV